MKKGFKYLKTFEQNANKKLNLSNIMFSFNDDKNYDDNFSNFLFDISGELGGGLPTDYFSETEINEIESNFRKIYDANVELTKLLNSKIN